jgi:hypothetical protein
MGTMAKALLVLACGPWALGCGEGNGGMPENPPACAASAAQGIAVAATDASGGSPYALGYAPYAMDGCLLLHVNPDGALVLRDLGSFAEETLAEAAEAPRRPAVASGVVTWEATLAGRRVVRVRAKGATVTVAGAFDHAGEPRAAADAVVFTGWLSADDTGDTDVFSYVPGEAEAKVLVSGPGQQRFADVSATHVAFSDFSEDPDGRFDENGTDLADVVVIERASGMATRRERPGKQAFPLLGAAGKVAYLEWGPFHPEPKFSAYTLTVGDVGGSGAEDAVAAQIETAVPYVRPAARGAWLEWVQWSPGMAATLWRRRADLAAEAAAAGIEGTELYAPVAAEGMALVLARVGNTGMEIRAVSR